MDIIKKNRKDERRILIAMIVDSVVLGRISGKWDKRGLFKTKWANVVGKWCVEYYKQYEKAPQKNIQGLYEQWAAKSRDTETVRLVEKFLETLSTEYEALEQESNTEYLIDLAGKYFNQVKAENLISTLQSSIEAGDIDSVVSQITTFNQIELGGGEGIDPVQDDEAIKAAFSDRREPLITYPGALGEFFGDTLERDALVAFLAPEKRGKSFFLLDMAYRAMLQKRRVAFFEAGDMSQNQVMRRLMVRVAKKPMKRCLVEYPLELEVNNGKGAVTKTKRKRFKRGLNYKKAIEARDRLLNEKLQSNDPLFKLSCHPNSTLSINGIKNILTTWEQDGWVPDVIIIDYSDILNMDHYGLEGRDRINETWKQMRGMSQQYHCLVVTATQANAASYGIDTLSRSNFSEDKRKLAHVTAMIGINTSDEEKEHHILRLNYIARRESEYNEESCVCVAACLELANPCVISSF
jgi:hypothetical protein